jgi:hypothetical protein
MAPVPGSSSSHNFAAVAMAPREAADAPYDRRVRRKVGHTMTNPHTREADGCGGNHLPSCHYEEALTADAQYAIMAKLVESDPEAAFSLALCSRRQACLFAALRGRMILVLSLMPLSPCATESDIAAETERFARCSALSADGRDATERALAVALCVLQACAEQFVGSICGFASERAEINLPLPETRGCGGGKGCNHVYHMIHDVYRCLSLHERRTTGIPSLRATAPGHTTTARLVRRCVALPRPSLSVST